MGIMRWALYRELQNRYPQKVALTYGYITKYTRMTHQLPKSHQTDARCISGNPQAEGVGSSFRMKFVRKQNRSLHRANPSKGGKRRVNTIREVYGFGRFDRVLYRGYECFIYGLRRSGYAACNV